MQLMQSDETERAIVRYLDIAGIRHSSVAYKYLITAIGSIIRSNNRVFKVRDIYEQVGDQFHVKWTTVERSVRLAINRASNDDYKRLTCKEFIARIVDELL